MKPPMLIGTFQNRDYDVLRNVVATSIEAGFVGFDTAPSYGTEVDLGRAVKECSRGYALSREDFFLSDKIDVWQMYEGKGAVRKYVESALRKLDTDYLDILWIHWPWEDLLDRTWASFLEIKEAGLIKDCGICNVRVRHLREWEMRGIRPGNIQIERHPLRVCDEEVRYCHRHGIRLYSYSPLCRMHSDLRNSELLNRLAEKYDKNVGQIILRWQIDSGAVPVFMSKKPERIIENSKVMDFQLTSEEVAAISTLDQNYKIFLESWGCPGF